MASYNYVKSDQIFNCNNNFQELCTTHNILISEYCEIKYKKGWVALITNTLEKLKNTPVKITMVDDSYGEIDIKFETLKNKAELITWRLIDDVRHQSRTICMSCGNNSVNIYAVRKDLRLCRTRHNSAGRDGFTGTWLDKY